MRRTGWGERILDAQRSAASHLEHLREGRDGGQASRFESRDVEVTALRLIGASWGRTATQSLQRALMQLGYDPCYHMDELNLHPEHLAGWRAALRGEEIDWQELLFGYEAAVDWPASTFWRALYDASPDALVLLTMRDFDEWYDSVCRTIVPLLEVGLQAASGDQLAMLEFGRDLIFEGTFGGRFADREHVRRIHDDHVAHVRETVPPDRLLCFSPSNGWEPLCRFLGVDVPPGPFPHSNRTGDFTRRLFSPE